PVRASPAESGRRPLVPPALPGSARSPAAAWKNRAGPGRWPARAGAAGARCAPDLPAAVAVLLAGPPAWTWAVAAAAWFAAVLDRERQQQGRPMNPACRWLEIEAAAGIPRAAALAAVVSAAGSARAPRQACSWPWAEGRQGDERPPRARLCAPG